MRDHNEKFKTTGYNYCNGFSFTIEMNIFRPTIHSDIKLSWTSLLDLSILSLFWKESKNVLKSYQNIRSSSDGTSKGTPIPGSSRNIDCFKLFSSSPFFTSSFSTSLLVKDEILSEDRAIFNGVGTGLKSLFSITSLDLRNLRLK